MNEKIKTLKEIAEFRSSQLHHIGLTKTEKIRLNHELKLIEKCSAEDDFLLIITQADEARKEGAFYAKGSANCSFLLYCVNAVTVNPFWTNSPFERFFSPLKYNTNFQFFYEISRERFHAEPENSDALLDDVILRRAKKAGLVDDRLSEIAKDYPPACNYQFIDEVLSDSEGQIIWQEQVIKLLHRMGGFSIEESDYLRRDGGKGLWEKSEWYSPLRKRFLYHAQTCGYDYNFADKYLRYIFEANQYARLKASVAAQVLFD